MTVETKSDISRSSTVKRKTSETDVNIQINLDGIGRSDIKTGIGFFDHMLNQLACHGLFDLDIKAAGDLNVDNHHTIEDVGLTLGEAFSRALGTRKGIVRMGEATVPMDESLAFTCVDFSGRPYCVIKSKWQGESIAAIPTSLLEHFWSSFAITSGCNIHIRVLEGQDNHHMAEAIFKSAARAILTATRIDPRRAGVVPSSKGTIGFSGTV
ncbi:imidazoleglycerol-phosphate dehydratase HisB [Leptolinea tardivitalis]|uniref:Imidazoleglycerol-phosphate dehydratase n=1 Tax=Leptolinea tardivitalis TaxID=229920 RepID=A0A0P6WVN7_9CHLR|nr:imidazoleglycerol-phosphate dehydratase HisB [Leptolinea tardivitalis]KPL74321.1 imidazoleglycerol-phosphate dehydratase [Leptolinea tardivitalis]GAP20491.1 imidazoleglycerol-phosphate dehydratase [Leptolinea tardivitalis]